MPRDITSLALATVVALAAIFQVQPAQANGRYPAAQQLATDPENPNRLWLRATYGVLTSNDAGESWEWICESAIGYGGEQDPMLAVTEGKVFAATSRGLAVTIDGGCSWKMAPEIGATEVVDIALEGDGRNLLALAHVPREDHYELVVFRLDAASESTSPVAMEVASDLIGETLDPAPSDPKRIYVTGSSTVGTTEGERPSTSTNDGPGFLMRSSDGGASWQRLAIPGASLLQPAFIAAVHPTDPDVLYVRVQGKLNDDGFVESFLLYSDDAGESWLEIFRGPADLLGFVLRAEGSEVLVGLGDPRDSTGARPVDREALGIYRASTEDFEFSRTFSGQVGCLTNDERGLFICGNQGSEMFEVGLSVDGGMTATGLAALGAIKGPLLCGGPPSADPRCAVEWESACSLLGQCPAPSQLEDSKPSGESGPPARAASGRCSLGAAGGTRSAELGVGLLTALVLFGRRRYR
jgi:hypothetical protein